MSHTWSLVYVCVGACVCGGTLPQNFKSGEVDRVPDEHSEIDGFH